MSKELKKIFELKKLNEMSTIGKTICDFCIEKNIENIIFLDRSARPAYIPFKQQWKKSYNNKQRPNIYFLSPKKLEETYGLKDISEEIELFKKEQPYLTKNKGKTLIFDVCVKTGLTFTATTDLLIRTGFEKVYTMVTAIHEEQKQYFEADKIIHNNHKLGCHLFGRFFNNEIGIERNPESLCGLKVKEHQKNINENRQKLSYASKF